jgi:Flp pilus assembly protein TadD
VGFLPGLAFALVALIILAGCARVPKLIVLTDPLSAEEHVMLGVGYEQQAEFFLAEREYGRALKKDPRCFQARINLGNVALAQREYQFARKQYLKALEIRPGDPEATNNLAMSAILSRNGKWMAEARARLEAVLADPSNRVPVLLDTKRELDGAIAGAREAK